jgi:hypothetical protein
MLGRGDIGFRDVAAEVTTRAAICSMPWAEFLF